MGGRKFCRWMTSGGVSRGWMEGIGGHTEGEGEVVGWLMARVDENERDIVEERWKWWW